MAEIIIIDSLGGPSSTVRCGLENTARGNSSTISGGNNNTASGNNSTIAGGFSNTASNCCSTIAGGSLNFAGAEYSFIGSGRFNTTDNSYSVVVGGENNFAGCECTFVGGGQFNSATSIFSTVVGGNYNLSCSQFGTIVGGHNNSVIGACSSILGGNNNTAFSNSTIIGGGTCNESYSTYGTIGGGYGNKVYLDGATIAGGESNTAIQYNSSIAGGYGNTVDGSCSFAVGNSNVVSGNTSFVLSNGSTLNANNSAILGGISIIGNSDNTVYVPQLNISNLNTGTTVNSLGIDSNGLVIVGNDFTGDTPTLSEVISIGNETGGDIVMTNGTSIKSNLEFASLLVNDFTSISGEINMGVTKSGVTSFSSFNLKSGGIDIISFDDDSQSQISIDKGQISISTNSVDPGSYVDLNNFRYTTADVTITGNTSANIIEIPISPLEFRTTNVKIWCNAYDNNYLSGLTQEFTSGYLLNNLGVLYELSTDGPTLNLNESTFSSNVTSVLTYDDYNIIVSVENGDIGDTTTIINWRCRARRSS